MADTTQQPLNRAGRRAQGRTRSAGRGAAQRQALKAYGAVLQTALGRH